MTIAVYWDVKPQTKQIVNCYVQDSVVTLQI